MRATQLARVAAEAEKLRLEQLARRQVSRAVKAAVAAVFAIAALAWLHVLGYLPLARAVGPIWAAAIIFAVDAVLAVIIGLMATSSSPGVIEAEALQVRQRALVEMRESLAWTAMLPALGLLIGSRRARGGLTLASVASRLLGRRSAGL